MSLRTTKACISFLIAAASLWFVPGCTIAGQEIDPDIGLQASLAAGSDLAIFLLQNAAASLF
jgi:hypothetical protein